MSQFPLQLPQEPVLSRENFVVSEANREAFSWVEQWPEWPSHCLIIYGSPGCGKTHLARLWQEHTGAVTLNAASLHPENLSGKQCYILENLRAVRDQAALLHLYNGTKEAGGFLLCTADAPPGVLGFTLPDILSRLQSCPASAMREPDDALLAAVMTKYFSDRQLRVEREVVEYLVPRIARSFAAAWGIVEAIDRRALETQRTITVPLVREVLEKGE